MKQLFAFVIAFTITTTAFSQAGQKWSTSGNANSNGDFIGSTNNEPLIFKTNDIVRGKFTASGKFQIKNLEGIGFRLLQTDSSGKLLPFPMSNANEVLYGDGTWRPLPTPPPSTWELNGTSLFYLNGKVGIGTKTPFTNFDVIGDAYISNNLYVGGGIIITEKINANKEVLTATLRADSIIMDSTKAVYGYSVFKDQVRLENKLQVVGNTQIDGNLRLNGELSFGNNKRLGYLPPSGGNPEVISFGGFPLPPLPNLPCLFPAPNVPVVNQFDGMIQAINYSIPSLGGTRNILSMGFDGANGIIDMSGTNTQGGPGLLINWYCGKDVGINTNPANAGNVTMTSATMGMVGIGTTPSTKLDVNGQITMRTGAQNGFIPVSDGSGKMTWTNPATITTSSLWQSNSSGIYFNTGGNVGIGTTSFGGKLAIEHSFDNNGSGRANHIYLTDPTNVKIKGYIGINKNTAAGTDKEYLSIQAVEENEHWMNIVLGLNGGNVGIGTAEPTAKLDVDGSIKGSGDFISNGFMQSTLGYKFPDGSIQTTAALSLGSQSNPFQEIYVNNYIKIGTNSLWLNSGTGGNNEIYTTNGALVINPVGVSVGGGSASTGENTYINPTLGNVGIGTINPQDKFQVGEGFNKINMGFLSGDENSNCITSYLGFNAANTTSGWVFNSNGSHNGGAVITASNSGQLNFIIKQNPSGGGIPSECVPGTGTSDEMLDNNQLLEKTKMVINPSGNVGIGTNAPTTKLEVNGNTKINGVLEINNNGTDEMWTNNGWRVRLKSPMNSAWVTTTSIIPGNPNSGRYMGIGMTNSGWYFINSNSQSGDVNSPARYPLVIHNDGLVTAREIEITLAGDFGWPDFVFNEEYQLKKLSDLEKFIKTNKHLPNVPTEKEVKENGIKLGDMNAVLLQKIEELTLYIIDLEKRLKKVEVGKE
ncbi:MAG: hypothetical protein HYU68_05680 [Bacteroidetes bacterium]|nr:hypothetical protein [Bacteroidota bacterium]